MAIHSRTKISAVREFTDRVESRQAFWNRLDRMLAERGSTLVTYYGTGGVGKSGLIKKLKDEFNARREEFPNVVVLSHDFINGTDCRAILNNWKNQLKEYGCEFPFFETGDFFLSVRRGVNPKLLDEPEVKSIVEKNKWIERIKTKFDLLLNRSDDQLSTARPVSMLGMLDKLPELDPLSITGKTIASVMRTINKRLSKQEMENRLNAHINLRRELTEKVSSRDINELEELLPTLFARDVLDWAGDPDALESKRLIIFLDTYEMLTGIWDNQLAGNNLTRDWWIRDRAHDRLGLLFQLPPTLWVIGGRNKLRWTGAAAEELDQHLIKALSEDDSNYFLTKAGVWSRELRDRIYQLTKGYPLYLDLCLDTYEEFVYRYERVPTTKDFGHSLEQIVQRLVKYLDPAARLMVQCLGLLGTWTGEMARCIVPNFNYNLYVEAKNFSFIQSQSISLGGTMREVHQFDRTLQKFFIEALKSSDDFRLLIDEIKASADHYFNDRLDSIGDLEEASYYLKWWAELTARLTDDADELEGRYSELFRYSVRQLIGYGRFSAAEDIVGAFLNSETVAANDRLRALFDHEMGLIQNARGDYRSELIHTQSAYEKYAATLGGDHADTIDALERLIVNLLELGEYEQAAQFRGKLLNVFERLKESEPTDALEAMYNAARALKQLECYDEALELYDRMLAMLESMFGSESSEAMLILEKKAEALSERQMLNTEVGQELSGLEEILTINERVLKFRLRALGERDLNTIRAMETMANTLTLMHCDEDAVDLLAEAFELRQEIQGDTHLDTLEVMIALVQALNAAGRSDEALELSCRCLSIVETNFDSEHPLRLKAMEILSTVLSGLNRHDEALTLKRELVEVRKRNLGEDHLETTMAMLDLAGALTAAGRTDEAEALLSELGQNDFIADDDL